MSDEKQGALSSEDGVEWLTVECCGQTRRVVCVHRHDPLDDRGPPMNFIVSECGCVRARVGEVAGKWKGFGSTNAEEVKMYKKLYPKKKSG
jgi:hypothetical protein